MPGSSSQDCIYNTRGICTGFTVWENVKKENNLVKEMHKQFEVEADKQDCLTGVFGVFLQKVRWTNCCQTT